MSIAKLNAEMAEETPQETKQGKREGQERNAQDVRLPQQGILSRSINQIKDGVADDYHDSPTPPNAQHSAERKCYPTPLVQKLIHGDCLDKLKLLADNSVDLLCTDAPYGLLIGGEKWDKLPSIHIWKECLRVLKPGAFAYIMSSARQDLLCKMISDIADAGFETNFPSIYWAYRRDACPSGYNISKKIDKDAGVLPPKENKNRDKKSPHSVKPTGTVKQYYSDPKTDLAKQFVGAHSGFNPIPAVEIIIVAMKPMDQKTFLDQILSNRKGSSWLGNCRIPQDGFKHGRFPSNLIVTDHALGEYSIPYDLNRWAYERMLSKVPEKPKKTFPFLTVQKVGQKEKNAGLTGIENTHLTVKPLELFEYLIEMGSQPGDLVADPFCGSGTSCVAAKMLGRGFIGIELIEDHYRIAKARVENFSVEVPTMKRLIPVSDKADELIAIHPAVQDAETQFIEKNIITKNGSRTKLYQGNCLDLMPTHILTESIDLTVTSPPYDTLRKYKGYSFNFEGIARELYRVTKQGGVLVWVVGDKTTNGSESATSYKQVLYFMKIGFNLHDSMIYRKANPIPLTHNRYEQEFEFMFVFSKGRPKTFNPILKKCKTAGQEYDYSKRKSAASLEENGAVRSRDTKSKTAEYKIAGNIWEYSVGNNKSTSDQIAFKHPAIFPEKLAADHIESWSNEGDTVFDPMMGSNTTGKMASRYCRNFVGIEIAEEYYQIAVQRVENTKISNTMEQ